MFRSRNENPLQRRLGSPRTAGSAYYATELAFECLEDRSLLSAIGLDEISIEGNTGEKPQSKVWEHAGQWWTAIAEDDGTWISRLDGTEWTHVLKVSSSPDASTDVRSNGDLAHILLLDDSDSQFATVEYSAETNAYVAWSVQPSPVTMGLPDGIETATIDIDSQGRMWVAYDQSDTIEVRYSDGPYTTWSAPITIAEDISSDDISVLTAMPNNQIGVLWSNQSSDRFGFRYHNDGDPPNVWSQTEIPALQNASNMADDHLNVAVGSDGTLYVAAKTSFDSSGKPKIVLLVRRPNGAWEDMISVDTSGTRGIVLLNEAENRLMVVYTSSENGGNILYKESALDNISFGSRKTLISSSSLNNVTSTKQNFTDEVVLLASSGGGARGVLFSFNSLVINAPPVVNAGADQSHPVDQPLTLQGTASDDGLPGALTTTWSMVSGPGTVTFGNASSLSTTAQFSQTGTYVLRLTASDGQLTAVDDRTINVGSPSTTPSGGVTSTLSFQQGVGGYQGMRDTTIRSDSANTNYGNDSTVEFDGSPQEAALLAWDLSSIPSGSTVTNFTLQFNVSNKTSDTYEIYALEKAWNELTATWNQAASGQSWSTSGGDRGSSVLGEFAASSTGNYQITLNSAGIAAVQAWIDNPAANHGLIIQDFENASDGAHITSSEASNASQRPKITVTFQTPASSGGKDDSETPPTNTAPVVEAGTNRTVTLGNALNLQGTASDDGLPGALATTWSVVSGPGNVTFGSASSMSTTAQFSTAGNYVLRLTATDGELTTTDQLTVTVNAPAPTNTAPTVEAGTNRTVTLGNALNLQGTASDDGLPGALTTTWSVVSGPGNVTFGSASSLSTTAQFSTAGNYVLRLTATDGELTTNDQLTVTVNAAPSPSSDPVTVSFQQGVAGYQGTRDTTIRSGSANSNYGNETELEFDGSPDEAALIAWDLSSIPTGSTVTSVTLQFNVSNKTSDTYELYAVEKAWNELNATWNQAASGQSWANGGGDRGNSVLGQFAASSTGNYQITLNSAGIAAVQAWIDNPAANHGLIIQDFDNASDGAHVASSEASSVTQRPKITITYQPAAKTDTETPPTNTAPVVEAGANRTVTLGNALNLQGTASDDGLPGPLATTWSVVSGPGNVTFGSASSLSTTAQFSTAGNYVLRLTATDGELTTTDQLTVTVNAAPAPSSDPVTVSFQQGVNGYQGTRDTTIRSDSANENFGNEDTVQMDGSPDEAALIAWDLSSIPTGSTITGVSLEFTLPNHSDDTYELYAVDRAWDELSATWDQAASGQSWSSAGASGGGDHSSAILGEFYFAQNGMYQLTLNDLALTVVQSWIDNPTTNNGFIIQDYDNASDGAHFYSSESSNINQRPKINVTYRPSTLS